MSTVHNIDKLSVALARTTTRRSALKAMGVMGIAALTFGSRRALAENDGPNGVCRLDKGGTFAPNDTTSGYSVEVGGDNTQHWDLYRQGRPAVSIIVPAQEPVILDNMLGGFWEGADPDCVNYDYVKDASGYANGRLDNGHSGIVVDLTTDTVYLVGRDSTKREWKVSGNGNDLSFSMDDATHSLTDLLGDFAPLFEGHDLAWEDGTEMSAVSSNADSSGGNATCSVSEAERLDDIDPVADEPTDLSGYDDYTLEFEVWSNAGTPNLSPKNNPDSDSTDDTYVLFLKPGERPELMGAGGALWGFPEGCESLAADDYNKLPAARRISVAEYQEWVLNGTWPTGGNEA